MKPIYAILFVLLSSSVILGQKDLSITVTDTLTNEPISDVNVLSTDGYYLGKTNNLGVFKSKLSSSRVLMFDHISYDQKKVFVALENTSVSVQLSPKSEFLKGVIITAKEPEVVFKDETYHASDYEFIDQDNLLILTYEKKRMFKRESQSELEILERCKLVCLDKDLRVRTESTIIPEALELQKDQYGQCFLRSIKTTYFIMVTDQGIMLDEMPEDFKLSINQDLVLDEAKGIQLVSDYDESYPEFNYFLVKGDNAPEKVCTVHDEKLMHLFRAQYRNFQPREKLEAYRMELKTGIDKEVISGYMSGFHHSIYFNSVYAPVFKIDSSFIVFNHITDLALQYDFKGHLTDSIEIDYHVKPRKTGWGNQLIQDEINQDVYTYFELNGNTYLCRINTDTGLLENELELSYRYPEQLGVNNGQVYYLYRPFGSSQKKYLYKEGDPHLDFLAN